MPQSGYTSIQLYHSSTSGVVASGSNLYPGELFINSADGKLYYKDPSNVVKLLASNAATGGGFVNLTVTGVLTVNDNAAAIPTAPTGSVLTVANVDGTNARVLIDGFGTSANGGVLFRKANGTAAAPSAVQSGDVIGVLAGYGYGASAYGSATRVSAQMVASENWTNAAQGAYLSITTTQTGTTTTAETLRIGPFGEVGVYTGGGVNYGTAGQAFLSGGVGAPPVWSTLTGTGTVTSVALSTGSTGLTVSGGTSQTITGAGTFSIGGVLALASGGTGASTAAGARTNLGLGSLATASSVDLASQVTGTLAVANGGTGQTTYTNGQLLIGNTTGNTLTKATLTAGTGITITNGNGSITIASSGAGTGTVTSVAFSTGTTGLSVTGSPITTSGTITLAGTLATANGGTGLTGFTSGGAVYATSTSALTTGTLPIASGGTGATTAAAARANLGAGTGNGTVTSVGMTVPSFLSVTGSPITSSGTLAVSLSGTALPVANGGTGLTSAGSKNAMLVSNGTALVSLNQPAFLAYSSANQSVTSGVTTLVQIDTSQWNLGGGTFVSNGYTAPTQGFYQIDGILRCDPGSTATGTTSASVAIYVNGSEVWRGNEVIGNANNYLNMPFSFVYALSANDVVKLYGSITSNGSPQFIQNNGVYAGLSSRLQLTLIGANF